MVEAVEGRRSTKRICPPCSLSEEKFPHYGVDLEGSGGGAKGDGVDAGQNVSEKPNQMFALPQFVSLVVDGGGGQPECRLQAQ